MKNAAAQSVHGETVTMEQSAAQEVKATNMEARQAAFVMANLTTLHTTASAVGVVEAQDAVISQGSRAGVVVANGHARLDTSAAGFVIANEISEVKSSPLGIVITRNASIRDSNVGVVIGRRIEGDVKPLLDTRGAILAGIVGGLVLSAVTLTIGGLMRRRP